MEIIRATPASSDCDFSMIHSLELKGQKTKTKPLCSIIKTHITHCHSCAEKCIYVCKRSKSMTQIHRDISVINECSISQPPGSF